MAYHGLYHESLAFTEVKQSMQRMLGSWGVIPSFPVFRLAVFSMVLCIYYLLKTGSLNNAIQDFLLA